MWFSDEGWKDIETFYDMVLSNLERVVNSLRKNNPEFSKMVIGAKREVSRYEAELRQRHIGRLHSGSEGSLDTSSVHLDLIDNLKRINNYTVSTSYAILSEIQSHNKE